MTNSKNLTKSRIGYFLLFCCFIAVAIYGMSTGNLTLGLFLVAGGCLLHAIDKGSISVEEDPMAQKSVLLAEIEER